VDAGEGGGRNLAEFIRATAGRRGSVQEVHGGLAVAGPLAVENAYITAAILNDCSHGPSEFFDESVSFFGQMGRTFIVWIPASASSFLSEAQVRGFVAFANSSPAMVVDRTIDAVVDGLTFRVATDDSLQQICGDVCERGYEKSGLSWLMSHQENYQAENSYWHIAFDGNEPVSVACGFRTAETGGIYYVATPPEFRGRGYGAAVTTEATNHLFDQGVQQVVLQSSPVGFGVYERLGFTVYDQYQRFTVVPT
jgi:ribosomal protein S18 acetylase RimI-like enzyme